MDASESWGPFYDMIMALVLFLIAQSVFTIDLSKFVERPHSIGKVAAVPAVIGQATYRYIASFCGGSQPMVEEAAGAPATSNAEKSFTSVIGAGRDEDASGGSRAGVKGGRTTFLQFAAKNYGGSFEPSTVEGVYQLWRMMPLWFASCLAMLSYIQASTVTVSQGQQMADSAGAPGGGIQANTFQGFADAFECLIYMYAIHKWVEPFFKKRFFEITPIRKFTIGFVFMALSMIAYGLIEIWRKATPVIAETQFGKPIPVNALSQWWLLIPSNLMAMGESFLWVGQIEWYVLISSA